jgi:hypothetical protein
MKRGRPREQSYPVRSNIQDAIAIGIHAWSKQFLSGENCLWMSWFSSSSVPTASKFLVSAITFRVNASVYECYRGQSFHRQRRQLLSRSALASPTDCRLESTSDSQ